MDEENIRIIAYRYYQERVRRGLTVDFEPDRTILERRDWDLACREAKHLANFTYNYGMRAPLTR